MQDPNLEPPVNPLPPMVVLFFLAIAGIEGGLTLGEANMIGGPGAIGWRLGLVRDFGFSGEIFDWMFVHLGFTHALFAMVLLLALGKMVAETMGQFVFTAIFVVSGLGGAVIYGLLLDDRVWMAGAYPSVYGLIGGYSFVLWRQLAGTGAQQYRPFRLIAFLMGIQLVWGVFFEVGTQWVAELAGFFVGFGLCFLLAPGEWAKIRDQIRRP
jgi:membrane associated rhomboid family serine protease